MTATAPTYKIVKGIAYGMFGTGLALSVSHTYDLFHSVLGAATLTSAAMPLFIDGLQVIGKLMRGESFTAEARKIGFRVQVLGAFLSLVANVVAGNALGDKIAGVVLVGGYILAEKLAEKIRPAQEDAAAVAAAALAAKRAAKSAAAKKGAATRAANKAKAKPATTRRPRKAAQRNWDAMVNEVAPVSPAPVGTDAAYL